MQRSLPTLPWLSTRNFFLHVVMRKDNWKILPGRIKVGEFGQRRVIKDHHWSNKNCIFVPIIQLQQLNYSVVILIRISCCEKVTNCLYMTLNNVAFSDWPALCLLFFQWTPCCYLNKSCSFLTLSSSLPDEYHSNNISQHKTKPVFYILYCSTGVDF